MPIRAVQIRRFDWACKMPTTGICPGYYSVTQVPNDVRVPNLRS
jgi:hypothetical protein